MAESSPPRPPAQAAESDATPLPEPKVEDLGVRSFAGQNIAEDREQQARDRGAGLGAGGSQNRDARSPAQSDGEVPEDDLD